MGWMARAASTRRASAGTTRGNRSSGLATRAAALGLSFVMAVSAQLPLAVTVAPRATAVESAPTRAADAVVHVNSGSTSSVEPVSLGYGVAAYASGTHAAGWDETSAVVTWDVSTKDARVLQGTAGGDNPIGLAWPFVLVSAADPSAAYVYDTATGARWPVTTVGIYANPLFTAMTPGPTPGTARILGLAQQAPDLPFDAVYWDVTDAGIGPEQQLAQMPGAVASVNGFTFTGVPVAADGGRIVGAVATGPDTLQPVVWNVQPELGPEIQWLEGTCAATDMYVCAAGISGSSVLGTDAGVTTIWDVADPANVSKTSLDGAEAPVGISGARVLVRTATETSVLDMSSSPASTTVLAGTDAKPMAISGDYIVGQAMFDGVPHGALWTVGATPDPTPTPTSEPDPTATVAPDPTPAETPTPDYTGVDLGAGNLLDKAGSVVVGAKSTGSSTFQATAWDISTSPATETSLGTLGGSMRQALNIDGSLVGGLASTYTAGPFPFSYRLGTDPSMVQIPSLGGPVGQVEDVDDGVLVGRAFTAGYVWHGFAYDTRAASPAVVDVGILGGTYGAIQTMAFAVDNGVVVGYAVDPTFTARPYFYDLRAATPSLVTLPIPGGAGDAIAYDVSGDWVVGYAMDPAWSTTYVVAWDISNRASPKVYNLGAGKLSVAYNPLYSGATGNLIDGTTLVGAKDDQAVAWDLTNPASPVVTKLAPAGAAWSIATSIDGAKVAGNAAVNGVEQAFIADRTASPVAPELLGVMGGTKSSAYGLEGNTVVGSAVIEGAEHAVYWIGPKLAQSVHFTSGAPSGALVGDTYTPAARATSGLPVVISVSAGSSSVCTITAGVVHFVTAGSCILNADQAGAVDRRAAMQVQTVDVRVGTTTTLTTSTSLAKEGDAVTFTASVSPAAATGTVELFDGADALGTCTLSSGSCRLTTSSLANDIHSLTAVYRGDASHAASTSAGLAQRVLCATACYVDDSGSDAGGVGSSDHPFATIQKGIDTASSGGTVHVAAGTYSDSVAQSVFVANKPVTLLGANAGVAGSDPARGPESIIDGDVAGDATANLYVVSIQSSDVVLDGFEVTHPGYDFSSTRADLSGVLIGGGDRLSDVSVLNNRIHDIGDSTLAGVDDTAQGINAGPTDGLHVVGNEISKILGSNGAFVLGLQVWGNGTGADSVVDLVVDGNVFSNISSSSAAADDARAINAGYMVSSASITNNVVSGTKIGLATSGSQLGPISVQGNTFSGITKVGVWHRSPFAMTLSNNVFAGAGDGIVATSAGTGALTATLNDLSGVAVGVDNGGASTVGATRNWWGQASGPAAGQAAGTGTVTTTPWIHYYTADPSKAAAPGFWPTGVVDGVPTGAPTPTEVGEDVVEAFFADGGTPAGEITFDNVTKAGETTATAYTEGFPTEPSGFSLGDPPVYFDISTTAEFSGSITLSLYYDAATFPVGTTPQLYHYESGAWKNVTTGVDTVNHVVTATVTSLSPFGLGGDLPPAVTAVSAAPTSPVHGQSVTIEATVADGVGTVTGAEYKLDGNGWAAMAAQDGTFDEASESVAITLSSLTTGPHTISVRATDTEGSTSDGTAHADVTVAKADTTTAVLSSKSPSAKAEFVTFTASVAAVTPGAGTPTGSVTFKDGSATLSCQTGSDTTLDGTGKATCIVSTLSVGNHSITAVYAGDGDFNGSTSSVVTQTVENTRPAADDESVSTGEDQASQITLSGSDANGDSLTFAVATLPSHGTLSGIGTPSCTGAVPRTCTATLTYTPTAGYNGSDSFTYTVNDGGAASDEATVSITVRAVDTSSGMVGWYLFDEGSGVAVNHGTTTPKYGDVTLRAGVARDSSRPSLVGNAYSAKFPGTYTAVGSAADNGVVLGDRLTVASWVRLAAKPTSGSLVWKQSVTGSNGREFELDVLSTTADALGHDRVQFVATVNNDVSSAATRRSAPIVIDYTRWYHVAMVWDGSSVQLYVDAAASGAPQAQAGSISDSSINLYMGASLDGYLDDVRIYRRALTPKEVSQLVNQVAYVVPDAKSVTYDDGAPTYTFSLHYNSATGPLFETGRTLATNPTCRSDYVKGAEAGTTHTISCSGAADPLFSFDYSTADLTISKASSTTTVTCTAGPFTFTGTGIAPCSATVTGAGGLSQSLPVSYANNTNAGTATATASFGGDTNHTGSSDSKTFTIERAAATVAYLGPWFSAVTTAGGTIKVTLNAQATPGVCGPITITASSPNGGTATLNGTTPTSATYTLSAGTYDIKASIDNANCNPSNAYDEAVFVVGSPGDASNGGGWYKPTTSIMNGSPRANFGYTAQKTTKTIKGSTNLTVSWKGQVLWLNQGQWRYKATIATTTTTTSAGAYVSGDALPYGLLNCPTTFTGALPTGSSGMKCAFLTGKGTLEAWDATANGGLGGWAASTTYPAPITFTATMYDGGQLQVCKMSGKTRTCTTTDNADGYGIMFDPVPSTAIRESAPVVLSGGSLKVN